MDVSNARSLPIAEDSSQALCEEEHATVRDFLFIERKKERNHLVAKHSENELLLVKINTILTINSIYYTFFFRKNYGISC